MKLQGRAAERYCSAPDGSYVGLLLHGPDASLIAERRQALVTALSGGDPMRVNRMEAAELRKDPALLFDALRARGFFAERPIVLVDPGGDGVSAAAEAALEDLGPEDGILVIAAGLLPARSSLRKLFEGGRHVAALGLYPEAPDIETLRQQLREAGLAHGLDDEAAGLLEAYAAETDRGSLTQTIERIALYGDRAEGPLAAAELSALLPATAEAETEKLIGAVVAGRVGEATTRLRRLLSGGIAPVTVLIQTSQHFRQLFAASVAGDPAAAVDRLRPRPFGARRDAMLAALRRWDTGRLEAALGLLHETDGTLRSGGQRPDLAILERAIIRLSIMAGRARS
ncbi:MAG: DNA polymerase III subunit delta [Pseudomonadota bacterium]